MPTIELTDEQADELEDLLDREICELKAGFDDPEFFDEHRHRYEVLRETLELLEIA
jgi:hypothetical protein